MLQVTPLCVLDFYIHENYQRLGYGKILFDYMLSVEMVSPHQLAYDRPSPKMLAFLKKNFALSDHMPQANNYVVYREFGLHCLDIDSQGLPKQLVLKSMDLPFVTKSNKLKPNTKRLTNNGFYMRALDDQNGRGIDKITPTDFARFGNARITPEENPLQFTSSRNLNPVTQAHVLQLEYVENEVSTVSPECGSNVLKLANPENEDATFNQTSKSAKNHQEQTMQSPTPGNQTNNRPIQNYTERTKSSHLSVTLPQDLNIVEGHCKDTVSHINNLEVLRTSPTGSARSILEKSSLDMGISANSQSTTQQSQRNVAQEQMTIVRRGFQERDSVGEIFRAAHPDNTDYSRIVKQDAKFIRKKYSIINHGLIQIN
jgi:hypothetical protein